MTLQILKGKRKIVNVLDSSPLDINNHRYQQLVKKINNCNASYWKCKSCPTPTIDRCFGRARQHLQMEAFKKYNEREEYRKAQEKYGLPIHAEVK